MQIDRILLRQNPADAQSATPNYLIMNAKLSSASTGLRLLLDQMHTHQVECKVGPSQLKNAKKEIVWCRNYRWVKPQVLNPAPLFVS